MLLARRNLFQDTTRLALSISGVALAVIVINAVGFEALQQTPKMIDAVAIVSANGRVKRRPELSGVLRVINGAQERFALLQNFQNCIVQYG